MDINELKYWIGFSKIAKVGPARFKKLYSYFPDLKTAWQANAQALQQAGLEEETVQEILIKHHEINLDQEWENLTKEKIQAITIKDALYPKLLKEIFNPPALLYYRGDLKADDEFAVAIVGTRQLSNYGRQATLEIAGELARQNITIISGLALGIDALAHQAALEAKSRTIAVLGSSVDNQSIYPAANRFLAEGIIAGGGAVISEFPIGTIPMPFHFPQRNRIIAGLALGTLVVEAGELSGALITARFALEQNREVFAVPGSIYNPGSLGPNNLIKMGAKTVTTARDILETLNLTQVTQFIETKKISPDTKEEEILLKYLSREPIHIDKLVRDSDLAIAQASSTLLMMEMKGKVRNLGGQNYVLAR